MIEGITNDTTTEALKRMLQFSGQRQRIIANNIANFSTPGFRATDVSISDFQQQLRDAIDQHGRSGTEGAGGLPMASTRQVQVTADGMILHAEPVGANLLFHDGNDRSVERSMQDMVENFTTYRTAVQLLRNRFEMMTAAIRERP